MLVKINVLNDLLFIENINFQNINVELQFFILNFTFILLNFVMCVHMLKYAKDSSFSNLYVMSI